MIGQIETGQTGQALQWILTLPITVAILILFIIVIFWYFKKELKERDTYWQAALDKRDIFWQKECERRDKLLMEAMSNLIDLNKLTNETWSSGTAAINKLKDWLEYNFKK